MDSVIDNDAQRTQVPPGQGKDETVTLSKAEVDSLRRDRDEARESERYWAGIARTGGGGARPAEEPGNETEDDLSTDTSDLIDPDALTGLLPGDTPEKLVDEIASQGVEAFRRRGFISRAEAEQIAVDKATEVAARVTREIVGNERQKAITDNQLLGRYPDLRNPQSELFIETAKIYREAVQMDPSAKKTPAALYLAAKAAQQMIDSNGSREGEQDRLDRINSQDGRSRGRQAAERDDMVGPEAAEVIRQMGVSEDAFKAEKVKLAGAGRPIRRSR